MNTQIVVAPKGQIVPVRAEEQKKVTNREEREAAPRLAPGQWMRVVLGFEAPFGHDGLPTVWG